MLSWVHFCGRGIYYVTMPCLCKSFTSYESSIQLIKSIEFDMIQLKWFIFYATRSVIEFITIDNVPYLSRIQSIDKIHGTHWKKVAEIFRESLKFRAKWWRQRLTFDNTQLRCSVYFYLIYRCHLIRSHKYRAKERGGNGNKREKRKLLLDSLELKARFSLIEQLLWWYLLFFNEHDLWICLHSLQKKTEENCSDFCCALLI